MNKAILITGAILGVLSIVFGAFGAHALKVLIGGESILTFETGVRYQMYHALLLLFIGNTDVISRRIKKIVFYLIVFGVLFFSFSIYGLATNDLTTFNFEIFGVATPIGGVLLISAWILMLIDFLKIAPKKLL